MSDFSRPAPKNVPVVALTQSPSQWQKLAHESDGSKVRSLSFALLLHGALIGLLWVGFATADIAPIEKAGKPMEFAFIGVEAARKIDAPKPARAAPTPPKTAKPQQQVAPQDTVTDHREYVAPEQTPDPFALQAQVEEDKKREAQNARSELEQLLQEQAKAAAKTAELQEKLKAQQKQADAAALQQAIRDEGLTGDVNDNSLLAQYQSAIQSTIESRAHLSQSLRPGVVCWVRVTQITGGEVLSAVPMEKCNASEQERRELIEGVMLTGTLPYSGFEAVFDRLVDVPFAGPK
jgi:colicin import membrane protein